MIQPDLLLSEVSFNPSQNPAQNASAIKPSKLLAFKPILSKTLARQHRFYVTGVDAMIIRTRGPAPLDEIGEDLLYHLYPCCQRILHTVVSEEAFWMQFYHHYCTTQSIAWENETARQILDALMETAVGEAYTDIHFTPNESGMLVRFRHDGLLRADRVLPKILARRCLNRLKILGSMNIAQQHTPQDGRFSMTVLGRLIDCRLSTHPTVWGEKIVIRLLDKKRAFVPLKDLGFTPHVQDVLHHILQKPAGLFVVTGPTGAGKTTTLYAILQQLNQPDVNIVTLESPVEYQLPGITQTEAERRSITYTEGLRSLLRQDPDIILIGEIRDAETAQMAMRAAMTGHKVLTTLHTQDVFGVLPRLLDFNIKEETIVNHVSGVLSQRLVRKTCVACAGEKNSGDDVVACPACHGTGFRGRIAVGEILSMDLHVPNRGAEMLDPEAIRQAAQKKGYIPLKKTAEMLVRAGLTTACEISRVLGQ